MFILSPAPGHGRRISCPIHVYVLCMCVYNDNNNNDDDDNNIH